MTTLEEAALARNERYVREFVEALDLCPYAKRCRESGKLLRRVVREVSTEAAREAALEVEALPADSVEVALLIFPLARADGVESARAFEAFGAGLRPSLREFFCVAFHPDLPRDLLDAHRAVQFIRRSPDPTLQLVRASVLRSVRGRNDGGTRVFDPATMSLEQLLAAAAPLSVSDRIAEANLETLGREGPDRVEALLTDLRAADARN